MATVAISTLDRILDPVGRALSPDTARNLVALRLDTRTQARLDRLARRCNEGTLSPEEQAEYSACVSAIDFVAILQAKARALLAGVPTA
jgi:hypothetical protein